MKNAVNGLKAFLDNSPSMYHAIAQLEQLLLDAGYTCLPESARWELQSGGKYYMTRGGSTLIAFRIPEGEAKGFMMSASHSDRPGFKLKDNGELVGKYTRIATEVYGGAILNTWLDRPLSVAGRVLVETEKGVRSVLVDIDRDLLLIPNVAIHMNRKVNEGVAMNPAVDTIALGGGKEAAGKLNAMLKEIAGGEILGQDLYLYIRQKASVWGVDEEYISAAGLDDLECAWCCTQGFLKAASAETIPVLCVFDSEEVGSRSVQGADSTVLEAVLTRICGCLQLDLHRMLSRSFMVSADNAHAVHPNHPEYADAANAPEPNAGVVLKFSGRLGYSTDGISAAIFRKICKMANVPVQTYCNRADLAGGGTLGKLSLSHVAVPTADIGLAQLAMHSAYETAGVKDAIWLEEAMTAYYSAALESQADGEFGII